ncbi:AAA family ATPase, partial [Mycobacterium avium subsp. hominissuis]|nr:AAA family ATPase [Mycobacterium avium subsp. hominissuis]
MRPFADAGIFEAADIHVAQRLTALTGESDDRVALAVALLVRALRGGSVCVDLRAVPAQVGAADLSWPAAGDWLAAVRASPLLGSPPVLRFFGDLLYFDRYWLEEEQVCTDLLALSAPAGDVEPSCYERLFPPGYEEQRAAARIAVSQALTVLTGGPGTGKTTTVARLLALL